MPTRDGSCPEDRCFVPCRLRDPRPGERADLARSSASRASGVDGSCAWPSTNVAAIETAASRRATPTLTGTLKPRRHGSWRSTGLGRHPRGVIRDNRLRASGSDLVSKRHNSGDVDSPSGFATLPIMAKTTSSAPRGRLSSSSGAESRALVQVSLARSQIARRARSALWVPNQPDANEPVATHLPMNPSHLGPGSLTP